MTHDKVLQKLHENEKKILKALEDRKSATIQELVEATGLVKDALEKASMWAKTKGVVKIREDITEFIELTKEGLQYVEEGLPEKNLIKVVIKGEKKISNLRKKAIPFPYLFFMTS